MGSTSRLRFTEHGLEKRKACDHCHVRKIKCDARCPECSHCTLYNMRCIYTPHIRRQRKGFKSEYKKRDSSVASGSEHLSRGMPQDSDHDARSVDIALVEEPDPPHTLPSPADYSCMVDDYFANFNNVFPLFNERKFRIMLESWTSHAIRHDSIAWACTNTVLALAIQYRATSVLLSEPYNLETLVQNANSVMGDLVSQAEDLRCVQVLLGMAMLSQTNCNSQSSSVLLATTIKLAHRMRLHRRPASSSMDDEDATERACVFWILYVLDREISIKAREPYLQRDCDIDIELPGTVYEGDSPGMLFHPGDGSDFNFFQARVHLARVQGSIYDWTCSTSAEYLSAEEKRNNQQCLGKALSDWQNSIPSGFRYDDMIDSNFPTNMTRHLLMLHFEYFHSVFKAYSVSSDDPAWIRCLTQYSDQYSTTCKEPMTRLSCWELPSQAAISTTDQALLPGDWNHLVNLARECMVLFREGEKNDNALLRATYCTYTSAMIIIIANMLTFPEHELHYGFERDNQLVGEALDFSSKVVSRAPDDRYSNVHMFRGNVGVGGGRKVGTSSYNQILLDFI